MGCLKVPAIWHTLTGYRPSRALPACGAAVPALGRRSLKKTYMGGLLLLSALLLFHGTAGASPVLKSPRPRTDKSWEMFTAECGIKVCIVHRPHSSSTSIALAVPFGRYLVSRRYAGGGALLAKCMKTGTTILDERSFKSGLAGKGANLGIRVYYDMTMLTANLRGGDAGGVIGDVLDAAFRPRLTRGSLRRARRFILQDISLQSKFPLSEFQREVFRLLFKDHPFGRPPSGNESSIERCPLLILKSLHAAHFCPSRSVLVICGRVDRSAVEKALETVPCWAESPMEPKAQEPLRVPERKTYKARAAKSGEGYVFAGYVIPSGLNAEERLKLAVVSELLTGLNGRITLEIRKRRGLVYSPIPVQDIVAAGGIWGVMLGVPDTSVETALALLSQRLASFSATPPTRRELDTAAQAVRTLLAKVFERNDLLSVHIAGRMLHGLPVMSYKSQRALVDAITGAAVAQFARRYFGPENLVTCVTE